VRIFPNLASCLRLTRALRAETHEAWLADQRYINMDCCVRSVSSSLERQPKLGP
jgi:hypothetical protein